MFTGSELTAPEGPGRMSRVVAESKFWSNPWGCLHRKTCPDLAATRQVDIWPDYRKRKRASRAGELSLEIDAEGWVKLSSTTEEVHRSDGLLLFPTAGLDGFCNNRMLSVHTEAWYVARIPLTTRPGRILILSLPAKSCTLVVNTMARKRIHTLWCPRSTAAGRLQGRARPLRARPGPLQTSPKSILLILRLQRSQKPLFILWTTARNAALDSVEM
jgi:hypothetical protein